jgi:hypothetical protein
MSEESIHDRVPIDGTEADERADQPQEEAPETLQVRDRRQVLKALAATAIAPLPGKWSKPSIEVGTLPAHAQVSPVPTVYELVCASNPPSGEITGQTDYCLDTVAAILQLVSGTGPVQGINVILTCSNLSIEFQPPLPQTVATDATGLADYGFLCVTNAELVDGEQFNLVFSCIDPVNGGTVTGNCGTYTVFAPNNER